MAALAAALLLRPPTAMIPAPTVAAVQPPPTAVVAAPLPSRGAALVRQGLEAAQNGAVGAAAELFRQALAADDKDAATWNNLGVVLVRQGEWKDGLDAFRNAVRLDPRHAEARRNLAVTLDRRGRPAEAVPHYRAFLAQGGDQHPDADSVRRRLAELTGPAPSGTRADR